MALYELLAKDAPTVEVCQHASFAIKVVAIVESLFYEKVLMCANASRESIGYMLDSLSANPEAKTLHKMVQVPPRQGCQSRGMLGTNLIPS